MILDGLLCFTFMGFGLKADFETGRTNNLNATYEAIMEPAAIEAGICCARADETAGIDR